MANSHDAPPPEVVFVEQKTAPKALDQATFERLLTSCEPITTPIAITQRMETPEGVRFYGGFIKTRTDRRSGTELIDGRDAVLHAVLQIDGRTVERRIDPSDLFRGMWLMGPRESVAGPETASAAPVASAADKAPSIQVPAMEARSAELPKPPSLLTVGPGSSMGKTVSRVRADSPRRPKWEQVVSGTLVKDGNTFKVESDDKTPAGRPKSTWVIEGEEGQWFVTDKDTLAAYLKSKEVP